MILRRLVLPILVALALAGCASPQLVRAKGGATSTLEDLRGHVVVLTFWADWCTPCLAQMSVLADSIAPYADRVVFLPAYLQEKPGHKLDSWLRTQPQWFQDQVVWANTPFLVQWDRTALPYTWVIGLNGKVVEKFDGMIDEQRAPLFKAALLRGFAAVK
ncbi:MAG TPA: TlpA disulfide reductase family protein [Myxococcaceae bacterium]|jgi:thiol-disulfide isomerase/thioredoxin